VEVAQANIVPLMRKRYELRPDPIQALETAREYRKFMHALPKRADKLLKKLEQDELKIKVDQTIFLDLKSFIRKIGLILSVSIMAAAVILYMAISDDVIKVNPLPVSLSVLSVVVIWLLSIIVIYRRL
jgi:hypothetical protein